MSEFEQWCIIELFGHSRIAGLVTEQAIGGETFIRVDVPETKSCQAFSRFFGKSAIYSITPTTKETACKAVELWTPRPIDIWEIKLLQAPIEEEDIE